MLASRRIAEGDTDIRVARGGIRELDSLGMSFNQMAEQLEEQRAELEREHQKLEDLNLQLQATNRNYMEMLGFVTHELKNPLTPIKLSAQRILRRLSSDQPPADLTGMVSSSVQSIIHEVDLLDGLLREFSDFARLPEPRRAPVRLAEVAEQTVAVYAPSAPSVRFDIEGLPRDLDLQADPEQLRRVFSNLLRNAIHAMPRGGTVTVSADVVRKGESDYCRILFRDTGIGMDDETRRQAFVPYFTTKKEGTGLGLAIVERIVFDHNGQIWIESRVGAGTTVFIDLPLS
jgi:nitrogen fixation/metabolism regulation signal transduction histidine kinase